MKGGTASWMQEDAEGLAVLGRLAPHVAPQRQLQGHVQFLLRTSAQVQQAIEVGLDGWVRTFPSPAHQAAAHLTTAGGKRLRPLLSLLAARAVGGSEEGAMPVALAVELLHNGTLLHDDVIDEAHLRRDRPASHTIFGNAVAVIAGDFCYFAAIDSLLSLGDFEIISRAMDVARRLSSGELLQLERRGRVPDLNEAAYLDIASSKTGALFSFATWGGGRASGASPIQCDALDAFGLNLGIAYQIVDDLLDLTGSVESVGKSVGHDIEEGVITLPLTYAMQEDVELGELVRRYVQQFLHLTAGEKQVWAAEIVERTRRSGAVRRATQRALHFSALASDALAQLPACGPRDNLQRILHTLETRLR